MCSGKKHDLMSRWLWGWGWGERELNFYFWLFVEWWLLCLYRVVYGCGITARSGGIVMLIAPLKENASKIWSLLTASVIAKYLWGLTSHCPFTDYLHCGCLPSLQSPSDNFFFFVSFCQHQITAANAEIRWMWFRVTEKSYELWYDCSDWGHTAKKSDLYQI